MILFFRPTVDILHPENGQLLVSAYTNYPVETLEAISLEHGIDNIPGSLILCFEGGDNPGTISRNAGL